MNPSDANSSLATLRQLKELLDAGTLTPQEFEVLKQQLVFGNVAPVGPVTPASDSAAPAPPAPPETSVLQAPLVEDAASPEVASTASIPDWLAAVAPPLVATAPSTQYLPSDERRNPLTLVFAIGGALVLLGLILYLVIGRPTSADEHLTSASQTAADSTAAAPEVGPQAQQLTLPPAAPETIRVAPSQPLPAATVPPSFRTDSVAAPVPASPAKPAAPRPAAPAKAIAPPVPVAAPDSATKAGQQ